MKYFLAPLAGFTDAPFRRLCFEGGADLVYTEMVSAAGLAHGSSPTRHLMETMPGEGQVALQLFGSKAEELAFSCRTLSEGGDDAPARRFCEVNLNAGCPMTKVTREGAGAKLVEDPQKIYRLLTAMRENTALPVTLKTRLGPRPDRVRIFEILDAAEQAGAKGLIVHARFTSQLHGGAVNFDLLADVVSRAKIPVTGNGSVVDARTAAMMAKTGVAAIMIGRAALADPFLFLRLKSGSGVEKSPLPYASSKSDGITNDPQILAEPFKFGTASGVVENAGRVADESLALTGTPKPDVASGAADESLIIGGRSKDGCGAGEPSRVEVFKRHLESILEFREQLAAKFPHDHVPSADAFASVKLHTHLFRYFKGVPGAAALRASLNSIRTLAEISTLPNLLS